MLHISCVSYLNAAPFVHGLQMPSCASRLTLHLETPAQCAQSFFDGKVDVALVPVGAMIEQADCNIITDYCIGAVDSVYTVCLFADEPIESLRTIFLDTHSRTSVKLMQILAKEYWQIQPQFVPLPPNGDIRHQQGVGFLLIGDKTFAQHGRFAYCYDLAEAWIAHTQLPFAFAVWLAKKEIDASSVAFVNNALSLGIENIKEAIGECQQKYTGVDVAHYLKHNINYCFDEPKRAAVKLFSNKAQLL